MKRKKMKKKGFTLVELLVVIAIIAMLLAILMPALGKVRQLAQRIMCGTNLGGLGKAMLTYATDDKYESYPRSGASGTIWDRGNGVTEGDDSWPTGGWCNPNVYSVAGGIFTDSTLASNLYLLVRFADVSPDQFICPGSDLKKFELSKYELGSYSASVKGFTDVWDFGGKNEEKPVGSRGKGHNSYAYQLPMPIIAGGPSYPISTTSNPARAIAADRNPFWQDITDAGTYAWTGGNPGKVKPDIIPFGNATYHQRDGQNVLYADQHVRFEKTANCGVEMDNIYTVWGKAALVAGNDTDESLKQCGKTPGTTTIGYTGAQIRGDATYYPLNENDGYLVCDIDKSR